VHIAHPPQQQINDRIENHSIFFNFRWRSFEWGEKEFYKSLPLEISKTKLLEIVFLCSAFQ
jgi:hypothetical protein